MNNLITITEPVFSKGKYFKFREQYCYKDRLMMTVSCPICQPCYKNKIVMHYRIVVDDESYYIPEYAAVVTDCVFNPIDKNIHARINWEREQQPKDFAKAYKQIFKRDIIGPYVADRNIKKELRNINFVTYGNADPKKGARPLLRPKIEVCPSCEKDETIHPIISISLPEEYLTCFNTPLTLIPEIEGLEERLTFLWSTGEITRDITVMPQEDTVYVVTATDDLGCTYTARTLVRVFTLEGEIEEIISQENHMLMVTVSGTDLGPYSYLWNTGETTNIIDIGGALENSTYTVIVTGEYCSITLSYTI